MDLESSSLKIVMFPWLAHGHIFPYLELAKRILRKKKFSIYLCSTAINFPSINSFLHRNSLQNSIHLIQLHLHPNPEGELRLPPHYHTTKNLPSHLRLALIKAFQTAKSSFSDILSTLRPNLVIYDMFQPWAASAAAALAIPAVHFAPLGAATMSHHHHAYVLSDPHAHLPFPELLLTPTEKRSLDSLCEFLRVEVFDHDSDTIFVNYRLSSEVVLLKTTPSLEGKYIDYIASVSEKRILPVGSLVGDCEGDGEIMAWLDGKEESSTVYVSFGSEYFLSDEEAAEIAKGLELCGRNFIWAVRYAVPVPVPVPEGFVERVGERGRVVAGWAPQASILAHSSVAAFVSHCGWSSLNESIYHGVPVVGMPLKINMFVDAKMLVEAGACVEVVRKGDGVFQGEEIAKAIDVVFGLRRRARELSHKIKMEEDQAIHQLAHQLARIATTTLTV